MFNYGTIAENYEIFENDIFDCKVLWMVGESESNSVVFFIMAFLVWSLGRFLGRDVCLWLQ